MIHLALACVEVVVLAWAVQHLLESNLRSVRHRKWRSEHKGVSPNVLADLVNRYGEGSNSFLTRYPGFDYFASSRPELEGAVAYVDTSYAWIAAAEPLAAREDRIELLLEFSETAASLGKRALVIPVYAEFALEAARVGFGSLMIGSEPSFRFSSYPPAGQGWLDVVPAARQLSGKGAKVEEFRPEAVSEEFKARIEELTESWLDSRKTARLGFLNQVHPWLHSREKKYFSVVMGGKLLAYLAAIPIRPKKAWYLIDAIRGSDSPVGTTEILLLQAMRILKEQGCEEASLGVAPLAGLDRVSGIEAARYAGHRRLYRVLNWIFARGNAFYNFQPLYSYKMKFRPTEVRPVFLLYRDPRVATTASGQRLALRDLLSIAQAWLPSGLAHATGMSLLRLVGRLNAADLIKSQLQPGTIVRSVPPNWVRLLYRCRLTSALVVFIVFGYLVFEAPQGVLRETLRNDMPAPLLTLLWGGGDWAFLVRLHLTLIGVGALEYLAGTTIAASSVLGGWLLAAGLTWFTGPFAGASMSALGSVGGLYWFIRRRTWVLTSVLGACLLWIASGSTWPLAFGGPCAIGAGVLIVKRLLRE